LGALARYTPALAAARGGGSHEEVVRGLEFALAALWALTRDPRCWSLQVCNPVFSFRYNAQ
jgi:hypothetical protein